MNFALGRDFGASLTESIDSVTTLATHAMSNEHALHTVIDALESTFANVTLPPDALEVARRVHRESLSLARVIASSDDPWLAAQDAYKRQHAARSALDAVLTSHTASGNVAAYAEDATDYASLFGDEPRIRGDIGPAASNGEYALMMEMVSGEFGTIVKERRAEQQQQQQQQQQQPVPNVATSEEESRGAAQEEKLTTPAPEKRVRFERPPLTGGELPAPPIAAAVVAAAGKSNDAVAVRSPDEDGGIARFFRDLIERGRLFWQQASLWTDRMHKSDFEITTRLRLERIAVIDGRLRRLKSADTRDAILLVQEGLRNDIELSRIDRVAVTSLPSIVGADAKRVALRKALSTLPEEPEIAVLVSQYRESLIVEKRSIEDEQQEAVGRDDLRAALPLESLVRIAGFGTVDDVRIVVTEAVGATIARRLPLDDTSIDERSQTIAGSSSVSDARAVTVDDVSLISTWIDDSVRTIFSDDESLKPGMVYERIGGSWQAVYPSMLPDRARDLVDDPIKWREGFRSDLAPFDVIAYFGSPNVSNEDKIRDLPLLFQYVSGVGILRVDLEQRAEITLPSGYRVVQTFADRVARALGFSPSAFLHEIADDLRDAYANLQFDADEIEQQGVPLRLLPKKELRVRALTAIDVVIEQMWANGLEQEFLDASWFGQARQSYEIERAARGASLAIELPQADLFNIEIERDFSARLTPQERAKLLAYWNTATVNAVRGLQLALDQAWVPRNLSAINRTIDSGDGTFTLVTRERSISGDSVADILNVPGIRNSILNIDFTKVVDRQGQPVSEPPLRFDLSDKLNLYGRKIYLVRDLCDSLRVNKPNCNLWRIVDDVSRIDRRNTSDVMIVNNAQGTITNVQIFDPSRNTISAALYSQVFPAAGAVGLAIAKINETALPALGEPRPISSFLAEKLSNQDIGGTLWWDVALGENFVNWAKTVGTARAVYGTDVLLNRNFTLAFITAEQLAYWLDVVVRLVGVGSKVLAPRLATSLDNFGTKLQNSWKSVATCSVIAFASSVTKGVSSVVTSKLAEIRESFVTSLREDLNTLRNMQYTLRAVFAVLTSLGINATVVASLQIFELLPSLIGQLLGVYGILRNDGSGNIAAQILNAFMYMTTLAMFVWVVPTIATNLTTFLSSALYAGCLRSAARASVDMLSQAIDKGTKAWRSSGSIDREKRLDYIFQAALIIAAVGSGFAGSALASYILPSEWIPISVWNIPQNRPGEDSVVELVKYAGSAYARIAMPNGLWQLFIDLWQPMARVFKTPAEMKRFSEDVARSLAAETYEKISERYGRTGILFADEQDADDFSVYKSVWSLVLQMSLVVRDGKFEVIETSSDDNDEYSQLRLIGISLLRILESKQEPRLVGELIGKKQLVDRYKEQRLRNDDNAEMATALMSLAPDRVLKLLQQLLEPVDVLLDTKLLLLDVVTFYGRNFA